METLSDYMLLEIFKNLGANSMFCASKVCQRWLNLITNSSNLLKEFTSIITVQNDNGFVLYEKIPNGKYQNLIINCGNDMTIVTEKLKNFLNINSKVINNLTLKNCLWHNACEILSTLSNIKKLILIDVKLSQSYRIHLPVLEHLELINSTKILKLIIEYQLKTLKISNNYFNYEEIHTSTEILNSFLQTCVNLKELTLTNISLNSHEFRFNLESFTIEENNNIMLDEVINRFLTSQANSLRKVAISSVSKKPRLLHTILFELELTEIEINVTIVPDFYHGIVRNSSIKKLTLHGNYRSYDDEEDNAERCKKLNKFDSYSAQYYLNDEHRRVPTISQTYPINNIRHYHRNRYLDPVPEYRAADELIYICEAVEKLSIYGFNLKRDDFLKTICGSMQDLRILRLQYVQSIISPLIQFKKLEFLEINSIKSANELDSLAFLVIYSPNSKILKINFIPCRFSIEKFFIKIVSKAKNLEKLLIGSCCDFTHEMNRILCKAIVKQGKLNNLTLNQRNDQKIAFDASKNTSDFNLNFCCDAEKFFASITEDFQLGKMLRDENFIINELNIACKRISS